MFYMYYNIINCIIGHYNYSQSIGVYLGVLSLLTYCQSFDIDIAVYNTDNGKQLVISRGSDEVFTAWIGLGRNWTIGNENTQPLKYTKEDLPLVAENDDIQFRLDLTPYGAMVTWTTNNMSEVLKDCMELEIKNTVWYGGPEKYVQRWPLEKLEINGSEPYVIRKNDNFAVAERYWLNSKGAYVFFDDEVPLFVDQNVEYKNRACFIAKAAGPYVGRSRVYLRYNVALGKTAKEAHLHATNNFLGKPTGHPNEKMIREPIWTTWPKYKRDTDDKKLLEYIESIKSHGFKGQIELDENWETCFGTHVFNLQKFGNISKIVKDLKANGFRITLWIHPFVNDDCENYSKIGKEKGYFVKNVNGDIRAIWWESNNAHQIDFTNPEAAKWFSDRIAELRKNPGIDSFKFDAGETDYAIPPSKFTNVTPEQVPNIFTQKYVETCNAFGDLIEVRSAWRTQKWPGFLRMIDKESTWGEKNGLFTLVSTLLQMNMNGYTMVLPDMIGGNGYAFQPTSELIVRWMQANALMPAMQFGFLPWDYPSDQFDILKITKKFVKMHEDYSDKILQAMNASIVHGTPVNPPIWWVDPTDLIALRTNDEFLLGEDILVAPVLTEKARTRNIYLPKGSWKDGNTGRDYEGPITLLDHPAEIDVLPFFILKK